MTEVSRIYGLYAKVVVMCFCREDIPFSPTTEPYNANMCGVVGVESSVKIPANANLFQGPAFVLYFHLFVYRLRTIWRELLLLLLLFIGPVENRGISKILVCGSFNFDFV